MSSPFEPAEEALSRIAAAHELSPYQIQLLLHIARGTRYSDIACERGISEQTVKEQASAVLGRLGLRSRAQVEAAMRAAERRAAHGADVEELYVFLQLRFE